MGHAVGRPMGRISYGIPHGARRRTSHGFILWVELRDGQWLVPEDILWTVHRTSDGLASVCAMG